MRIGIFNPTLHFIGGAEYATIIMTSALGKHGHDVVVSTNKRVDRQKIMDIYGKKFVPDAEISLPAYNLFKWNPNRSQYFYVNALQMYVLKLNCDILVDVFSDAILPWADIIYFQIQERNLAIRKKREAFLLPYVTLLKSTRIEDKIVLACSRFIAQRLEKKGINSNVLYPPVDISYFNPNAEQRNKPRKNIVTTISRIAEEKKLEKIPYIAKLVDNDISFNIVGSAQNVKTLFLLKRLIKKLDVGDRVKLSVNVPRKELRELLWNSRVYLHTREYEPFGITIVEAMAAGCLPVVHDSGGPKEFVPQNLRYKAIEEGAMKIERGIDQWSPEKMEEIINNTKRFREEKFSERFLNSVNRVIETKSQVHSL